MTPTEEARFIELWQQGVETAAIAQRLGVPRGTVQSRAHRLQAAGQDRAPASGWALSSAEGADARGVNQHSTGGRAGVSTGVI